MKKLFLTIVIIFSSIFLFSQELNLPGDNLNLYGVLNLFQKSETLEGFERNLNDQDSKVNNLDLNQNGITDYISVVDHVNDQSHSIVLQVSINSYEKQDIAVIEVERINGQTHIQIIGDEDLYGKDYIVEPSIPNPGYTNDYVPPTSSWMIVNYMYNPYYVVYTSPYSWGYYPSYWRTWRPIYYHTYYNYHKPYYNYYNRGYVYRAPNAHRYYVPKRNYSPYYRSNYYHPSRPINYQQHNNYQSKPQHNNYQSRPQQPQHQKNQPQNKNNMKRTR